MNENFLSKIERARCIYTRLLELEAVHGFSSPSPHAQIRGNVREIVQGSWRMTLVEDAFLTNAALGKNRFGESLIPAPGWSAVELFVCQRRRLAFSANGEHMHLHHHIPGGWERDFGADDRGDSIPLIDCLFANDGDPNWQAFIASPLSKFPVSFSPKAVRHLPIAPLAPAAPG